MAARHTLSAEKRDIFGKVLGKYRKQGKIPGNLYAKMSESTPLWFNTKEVENLLKEVSETALIDIVIQSEKARPAVLRDVQHTTLRGGIIHIDAQQVNMKEKIQVTVPVEVTGESPAVTSNIGILETAVSEVEVEALPADLPESFTIDISTLNEIGDKITVANLTLPKGVEVITDEDTILAAILEPQREEEEVVETKNEEELVNQVETTEEANEEEKTAE